LTSEGFFNLFLLISALHGFLFSAILFVSKDGKKKSMLYLNLLVLSISLNNFQSWILAKHFFTKHVFLDYIHIPWHFFVAPFFYMFLIYYLKIADRSKNILKIIVPFFILIVCIRFTFIYINKNSSTPNTQFLFEKYTSFEEIISLLVSLSVFGYAFYILYKKENLFKDILSYDNLKWIYTFFKLGLITYIFWIIALAITVYLNFSEFIYSYYPLRILTTILIYWIGYQGILRLKIIKERVVIRKILVTEYNKPTTSFTIQKDDNIDIEKQQQFEEVQLYLSNHFTDCDLTLDSISNDLKIPVSTVSFLVNTYAKKNFSEFINQLRVEQAKKLLIDTEYNNYTVIAIGLESGFSSKSTFYDAFRKQTGNTPSAYKKTYSSSN